MFEDDADPITSSHKKSRRILLSDCNECMFPLLWPMIQQFVSSSSDLTVDYLICFSHLSPDVFVGRRFSPRTRVAGVQEEVDGASGD